MFKAGDLYERSSYSKNIFRGCILGLRLGPYGVASIVWKVIETATDNYLQDKYFN